MEQDLKKNIYIYVCMCCIPETNTALLFNYNKIFKKRIEKAWGEEKKKTKHSLP